MPICILNPTKGAKRPANHRQSFKFVPRAQSTRSDNSSEYRSRASLLAPGVALLSIPAQALAKNGNEKKNILTRWNVGDSSLLAAAELIEPTFGSNTTTGEE